MLNISGVNITEENRSTRRENPNPTPLYPPNITHGQVLELQQQCRILEVTRMQENSFLISLLFHPSL